VWVWVPSLYRFWFFSDQAQHLLSRPPSTAAPPRAQISGSGAEKTDCRHPPFQCERHAKKKPSLLLHRAQLVPYSGFSRPRIRTTVSEQRDLRYAGKTFRRSKLTQYPIIGAFFVPRFRQPEEDFPLPFCATAPPPSGLVAFFSVLEVLILPSRGAAGPDDALPSLPLTLRKVFTWLRWIFSPPCRQFAPILSRAGPHF